MDEEINTFVYFLLINKQLLKMCTHPVYDNDQPVRHCSSSRCCPSCWGPQMAPSSLSSHMTGGGQVRLDMEKDQGPPDHSRWTVKEESRVSNKNKNLNISQVWFLQFKSCWEILKKKKTCRKPNMTVCLVCVYRVVRIINFECWINLSFPQWLESCQKCPY